MNDLPERIEASLRMHGLLRRGQAMLVAVSGGVDSMVLLRLLHELSHKHAWRLAVAHLNHRLRGRSSDADERLVLDTARKLGLPVVVERADVRAAARAGKISLEMAARQVRHEFLARTAARLQIGTIALAHHANDQIELFFLRLFRGSGGEGLAGMKWRNPSPVNPKIELIRPLLDQTKAMLRDFANQHEVPFREDATNTSTDMQRNRIRNELLPLLRSHYQPALDRTVLRAMEILGAESEGIALAAGEWLEETGRPPFGQLPVAVQRRCIQIQLLRQKIAADFDLIEQLRTAPACRIAIGPQRTVRLETNGLVQLLKSGPVKRTPVSRVMKLQGRAGQTAFDNVKIRWSISGHRAGFPPKAGPGREFFDADKVGPAVILRHWQPGDRFQPSGMALPVKLQDLFVNQKIARERRHELVVATTAAGEVFWVQQLRIAEQFKLSKGTIRRLQWRWNPL